MNLFFQCLDVATREWSLFSLVRVMPIFTGFSAHLYPHMQCMSRVCDALLDVNLLGSFAAQNMTVVDAARAHT
jgi:hypothetical protein